MIAEYYIRGTLVNLPLNAAELGVELNYDTDSSSQAITISELEWGVGRGNDDAALLINLHKNGAYGVFQGLPLEIKIRQGATVYTLFDGYINTATAVYSCDRIVTEIVSKGGVDWLNDVADSKSFAYIYEEEGIILHTDFVKIPYVLNTIPNNVESFIALLTVAFLMETIVSELEDFKKMIAAFSGSGGMQFGEIFKLALEVLHFSFLITLMVTLIYQMIDLLVQPVKFHACMSELKLMQRGCESFGLTFHSSILENAPFNQSYILPEKYAHDINEENSGVHVLGTTDPSTIDTKGFMKGSLADLITFLKKKYNAKIIIKDKVLRLERRDYNPSSAIYQMPAVEVINHRLNTDDFIATYYLKYNVSLNNKHTMNKYLGTMTEVFTSLIATENDDMILTTGFKEVSLGMNRAIVKQDFSFVEDVIIVFLHAFDAVVNVIIVTVNAFIATLNAILEVIETVISALNFIGFNIADVDLSIGYLSYSNFAQDFSDRIGMLSLENDFVDIPMNFILETPKSDPYLNRIISNDREVTNTDYLYDNFHYINSFVPTTSKPNANQYILKEAENVPFCFSDYEKLRDSNHIFDENGNEGELITGVFNIENETIEMKYKINELYTDNLKSTKLSIDGK